MGIDCSPDELYSEYWIHHRRHSAVLLALVQLGLGGAIWTLGSFMLVNNILGNFVEPRIMGKGLVCQRWLYSCLCFLGFILGMVGMFLSVPITMTIKIILEQNEKTKWLAILLGTPTEAKTYLENKEMSEKLYKKSDLQES